jgi:hypothetical protein
MSHPIFYSYQYNANKRKIPFELSITQFQWFLDKPCFYCSSQPYTIHSKTGQVYNGIDRIDNNLGYNMRNCVACCKICNFSKSGMSFEMFFNWAEIMQNSRNTILVFYKQNSIYIVLLDDKGRRFAKSIHSNSELESFAFVFKTQKIIKVPMTIKQPYNKLLTP